MREMLVEIEIVELRDALGKGNVIHKLENVNVKMVGFHKIVLLASQNNIPS